MLPLPTRACAALLAALCAVCCAGPRDARAEPAEVPGGAPEESPLAQAQRLALEGDPAAQFRLGCAYEDGAELPPDPPEAARWYLLSAAQTNLALLCARGAGVPPDEAQAAWWLHRAAQQGFAPAQAKLGAMHEHGRGVAQDAIAAYAWYSLAAEGGDEGARRGREALAQTLSAPERAAAEERARAWARRPAR